MSSKSPLILLVVFATLVLVPHPLVSQETSLQTTTLFDGKSLNRPSDPSDLKIEPFFYDPIDPEFWKQITEAEASRNFVRMVVLGGKAVKEFGPDTDDGIEGTLAIALGLNKLGFRYGATQLFIQLIRKRRGSSVAQMSLSELSKIVENHAHDPLDISDDLLNSSEFGPVHPHIQSFISFHVGIFDLTRGFRMWSKNQFEKVRPDTYWYQKLQFLTAIGEVARNRVDTAFEKLKLFIDDKNTSPVLKTEAQLALARIHFERGEYETAYKLYEKLELPLREKGRVFLERAWAKYYLGDYSKSLGILKALKAPMFNHAISPESYILQMIIFQQLCHYEAVIAVADEFRNVFDDALKQIKGRKKLSQDLTLARMALKRRDLQNLAQLVNDVRAEYRELKEYDWEEFQFYEPMLSQYQFKDKEIQSRIDLSLEEEARRQAEDLVSAEEQIAYLDYVSQLDRLRIIRRGEKRNYEPERISYLSFDRISWIVEEYWTDELEDYKQLIKSRCDQVSPGVQRGGDFGEPVPEEFQ